jgi:hypothetical protein
MAYNGVDGKTLCLVDALHGSFYACGFDGTMQTQAPAFWDEEQVLSYLKQTNATAVSLAPLPLENAVVLVEPVLGLQRASIEKAKQKQFGELTALYVRKSSAEENLAK